MADQNTPPVTQYPGPYTAPHARPPGPDPKKVLVAFFVVLAVIAVVAIVVANADFIGAGGNSPEGALRDYESGLNRGDAKMMFDQTVLSLYPDYEERLVWLQQTMFIGDPHIEISNITVIDRQDMTVWQAEEANQTADEVYDDLGKTADDYSLLTYSVVLEYQGFPPAEFDSEVYCLLIDGTWYLAIWGLG